MINVFSYVLSDCKASSGSDEVSLYDGYCPNAGSKLVKLSKTNRVEFGLNLFRIGSSTSLTFTCTVSVFPVSQTPSAATTCTGEYVAGGGGGRRRRSSDSETKGQDEVEVTVQLKDSSSSSAADTCANLIIPTIFLANLF